MGDDASQLTERQRNELAYHRQHAREHEDMVRRPFSFDILDRPARRWWNAYWGMYAYLVTQDLRGRRVLVVGCGFGEDALRLARLGAHVTAFDLSPDSLAIARRLAEREGLVIDFGQMPVERLAYADDSFDCIVARDILHHVDIPAAMREIRRVARPGALFVVNEIYSHSLTDTIRRSRLVEAFLYPRMQRLIYGPGKPYITADERKMSEHDIAQVQAILPRLEMSRHYNFLVTRILPDTSTLLAMIDRVLLVALRPLANLCAGRRLFAGHIVKE
jgi:2-polyprenyl-3-methyl-5-hydroxy-6-metoxy-1,4-benzoquinol methylase